MNLVLISLYSRLRWIGAAPTVIGATRYLTGVLHVTVQIYSYILERIVTIRSDKVCFRTRQGLLELVSLVQQLRQQLGLLMIV